MLMCFVGHLESGHTLAAPGKREMGALFCYNADLNPSLVCEGDTSVHLCSDVSQGAAWQSDANRGFDLLKEPSGYKV